MSKTGDILNNHPCLLALYLQLAAQSFSPEHGYVRSYGVLVLKWVSWTLNYHLTHEVNHP